jgi:hypothetical protein
MHSLDGRSLICSFIRSVLLAAFPGISQTQSECSRQRANKSSQHASPPMLLATNTSSKCARGFCDAIAITKSWRLCRVHNCAQSAPDTCNERKRTEKLLLLAFDET